MMRTSRDSDRYDGGVVPNLDTLLFRVGLTRFSIPFPFN